MCSRAAESNLNHLKIVMVRKMRILEKSGLHWSVRQALLGLAFFLITPSLSHAATYYVNKAGRDSNSCTQGQSRGTAKLTIGSGIACLSGGDILIIGDGVYTEAIMNTIPGGLSGRYTTLRAENANSAIVRPPYGGYININHDYITLDGIWFDAINSSSGLITIDDNVSHIIIKNGKLSNTRGQHASSHGILVGLSDLQILNNEFFGISNAEDNYHSDHGIYLHAGNSLIEGNTFRDIPHGSGVQIYYWQRGLSGDNNIIRNNKFYNIGNSAGAIAYGVRVMFIYNATGTQIYNNLIYGNSVSLEIHNAHGTAFYNNTVYGTTTGQFCVLIANGSTNTKIRNNICYGNANNNIVDNSPGPSTIDHNLFTNPSFMNASQADFRLNVGSTAERVGADLSATFSTDMSGQSRTTPWDIGAFARTTVGSAPPPTPPPAPTNLRLLSTK